MNDPGQVQAVVSFLAPFLPYLIAGATEAAKGLGKKVGEIGAEAAWKKAQSVWSRVAKRLTPKQKAKAGVIAVDPADQDEVASFARSLVDTLATDPALTAELASALEGDPDVQEVIARNKSTIERVVQIGPGRKRVEADGESQVRGVWQES
jgi:hypothetical protein